jgi:hypothetical protein
MLDVFVVSTIILTIWGAIGPLIGVRYGQELAKRWQKEHWITDNEKEEYRRVLASLNRLNMVLAQQHCGAPVDAQELKRAMEEITTALNTSLFIADFLEKTKIAGHILDAAKKLGQGGALMTTKRNTGKLSI